MKNKKLIFLIVLVLAIISYVTFTSIDKRNKLNGKIFYTTAFVEKIKVHSKKSKTGHRDVIYFYFLKNDSTIHKLKYLPDRESQKRDIKLKDGFKIKVSSSDYNAWQLYFNEKADTTFVDKSNYATHIYNTLIHKNIIE